MKLERIYKITDSMCYPNFEIRPSAILDLFQSIAGEHANILNIGHFDLKKKDLTWVVMRIKYELYRPIKHYDEIKILTWPKAKNRLEYDRDYKLFDNRSGELIGIGTSKWIVININTRRIDRNGVDYPSNTISEANYSSFEKIDYFDLSFNEVDTFIVRHTEIDAVGHMNNTKYADLINFATTPKYFEINYIHELHLGDNVSLKKASDSGYNYYLGKMLDNVSFVMKVKED